MAGITGIELVAMTTKELEKRLAQEQESLQVLNGVCKERKDQIETHWEAIRSSQDALFKSIPAQAEAKVNIIAIQELLRIRATNSPL